jgi:hypothetical protein
MLGVGDLVLVSLYLEIECNVLENRSGITLYISEYDK